MKRINHILITAMVLVAVGMATTATASADYVNISEFNVAEELQSAPLNPDFVTYHANPLRTSIGYTYGYIPPPIDLSHLDEIPVKRIQAPGELPSSFDWRDSGNVTPIKNQSTCGTCWTFGTTSVLESAVLINESTEYNFSEQSIALCVDRSWIYLYDGADDPCRGGGWGWLAAEAFIKKGSVLESCNPYNTTALNCDGSCVCDDCAPVKRVDGYRLVTNDGLDLDAIKTAVYDHGPVTMSFYYDDVGLRNEEIWGFIYEYYSCSGANHLVSIIGWNDSVPHPDPESSGEGAWIVKNSWGTDWGNDGYFYLAYNSSCVRSIAYLKYKDPVPDEELLYWDEAGFVGSVGYGDSGAWMASNFTADQSGNLTHVDFWTTSNNAEYEIYVWDGYFGSELANQTDTCQEYGYYSIPLNTPIPMDAGQQFTIGVNMTTPGYGYPIPVETEISGTVSPTIQANVSFIRHNSSCSWTDMASPDGGENVCLRARMVATFPCTCGDICVNETGWWRDGSVFNANNTAPIQAAVDNAIEGDSVFVWNGTYDENVLVNKRLTLAGEGADVVTVTAASASDHVFDVTADYVNISGFNVTAATNDDFAGIYLNSVDHCNISDNIASNNHRGTYLHSSSNNTLTGNTASDNSDWDIWIVGSPSNTFTDNTLNGTTVSFTYGGDVSLKGEGSPAADSSGWHNISKFINAMNQSAGAWLYLNFSYSDSDLTGTMVESSLTVWKHNGTGWVKDGWDNGRYLDTTGNVVGVNITTFSVFAPMGVPPLHHINVTPTSKTLDINGSQDFIARGYAQDGAEISEYFLFEWAISDAYIGSLTEINDTATNFTAEHVGITRITVSNGSKTSNEVHVTVNAAEPTNVTVTNGTAIVTSGDVNVTCDFGDDVTGWINITAIGNATNSSEVNSSKPRYGLGSGDKVVSGVTVNVSKDILDELAAGNGTIRIEICYNATTLAALGIDASTLAIWKYDNATEWVKQPSTRSGTCVYADVDHLCTFGLVGSKATGSSSSSSSGGGGTYPPGWFGTPTPTVTATKAPANATAAPPGERVTLTPVPTKRPAAAKATAPAAEGTTAGAAKKGAPGFTAVFAIAGMLAIAYAMMRRRE